MIESITFLNRDVNGNRRKVQTMKFLETSLVIEAFCLLEKCMALDSPTDG